VVAVAALLAGTLAAEPDPADVATSVGEARARARLLHETISGVLQIMHRDFFRKEDRTRIPSASMEDVFRVLEEEKGVKVRWLGVNAETLDEEHLPQNAFEEEVVTLFSRGAAEHERAEPGKFRYAGAIQLHNSCLKCHVPNRTSLEDRVAALVVTVPVRAAP
jgi:hypothetical protein